MKHTKSTGFRGKSDEQPPTPSHRGVADSDGEGGRSFLGKSAPGQRFVNGLKRRLDKIARVVLSRGVFMSLRAIIFVAIMIRPLSGRRRVTV